MLNADSDLIIGNERFGGKSNDFLGRPLPRLIGKFYHIDSIGLGIGFLTILRVLISGYENSIAIGRVLCAAARAVATERVVEIGVDGCYSLSMTIFYFCNIILF